MGEATGGVEELAFEESGLSGSDSVESDSSANEEGPAIQSKSARCSESLLRRECVFLEESRFRRNFV